MTPTKQPKTKLYKVLDKNGKSFHGGDMQYSLPTTDRKGKTKPGAWHEVKGEVLLCHNGLHLTDAPPYWWGAECRIFEVEAQGVVGKCDENEDRKVAAKRVRLLRELTSEADLAKVNVFISGQHTITDATKGIALGSSRVTALGSSTVEARDSSTVEAWGSSTVTAREQTTIVSWKGKTGIKVIDQAACIVRSWGSAPEIVLADPS